MAETRQPDSPIVGCIVTVDDTYRVNHRVPNKSKGMVVAVDRPYNVAVTFPFRVINGAPFNNTFPNVLWVNVANITEFYLPDDVKELEPYTPDSETLAVYATNRQGPIVMVDGRPFALNSIAPNVSIRTMLDRNESAYAQILRDWQQSMSNLITEFKRSSTSQVTLTLPRFMDYRLVTQGWRIAAMDDQIVYFVPMTFAPRTITRNDVLHTINADVRKAIATPVLVGIATDMTGKITSYGTFAHDTVRSFTHWHGDGWSICFGRYKPAFPTVRTVDEISAAAATFIEFLSNVNYSSLAHNAIINGHDAASLWEHSTADSDSVFTTVEHPLIIFRLGQEVVDTGDNPPAGEEDIAYRHWHGETGRIIRVDSELRRLTVQFDQPNPRRHDANGLAPRHTAWNYGTAATGYPDVSKLHPVLEVAAGGRRR